MAPPKVFVSYSHDSAEHKQWVLRLATDLRENGVDAGLDQWDLALGQDVTSFMQRGILEADRVILVSSESYVRKSDSSIGGVGYERLVVTADFVDKIDTKKFIPIVRNNTKPDSPKTPTFLGPRLYLDFNEDSQYQQKLSDLLRELLGVPMSAKPPLGTSPFSGQPPQASPRDSQRSRTGTSTLSDVWFESQAAAAKTGLSRLLLPGHMELRFALNEEQSQSQVALLNAVRKSEISTFGWPIAINLESRESYRPKPFADGIRAEISIPQEESYSGKPSYDYWSLKSNGDFYLLQSLFEDSRASGMLFFNTRIVRITESLMFASNLYTSLGTSDDAHVRIRVSHDGLAGRTLGAAGHNRHIMPRTTQESRSESEIVVRLGSIRANLVNEVRRIAEPLFMLFEFQEFKEIVYTEIVRRFENGETS